jgi:hypothetical protein
MAGINWLLLFREVVVVYSESQTASVVYRPEFPATDPEVSGSILGVTRFSEKLWVWNGVHSAS